MVAGNDFDPELVRGLKALAETTFPKRCRCCNRVFADVADYVMQTEAMPNGRRSLKQSFDDDGTVIVDLYRNCPCGSTLMDSFSDRRNATPQGEARRVRFDELMAYLVGRGLAANNARLELLKFLRGEPSELLSTIHPPATGNL
ncbi:oxidoreductase [Dechloromonas sp. HYN0024]|uniref:oxidoreductase n=1 Tax=Dechloromonas sp. HYN0024 TaxID=2231055 RepID=UPI000E443285|nr:oxidoreductase [Dechloromonas sp. HYN0024]AXS78618.1 oxidoreductase [Dechloromonas sp. HYN0024]